MTAKCKCNVTSSVAAGDTHSLCASCLGAEHAQSALENVPAVRIAIFFQCMCFAPGRLSLIRGSLHQHSPRCWSRCRRGRAASALVGTAIGSVGGNGDGRVPISFPTHQIRRGSPLGGHFPPGRGDEQLIWLSAPPRRPPVLCSPGGSGEASVVDPVR